MAKFTAAVDLNIDWFGNQLVGAAGATHRIPDALYDEFNGAFAGKIPGLTWVTQDEASAVAGFDPTTKYDKTGGVLTGPVDAPDIGGVIYADQYSSIQAAIDAADTDGATVVIPIGTYAISTSLVLKSNLTLLGQGMGSKLVASTAISIARGTSVNDVTIANLYIDGGQVGTAGDADADLIEAWTGCSRWTVRDCYITRGPRDGIGLRAGSGHLVANNTIIDCYEDGITINGATDVRVLGNYVDIPNGDAILLKTVERATVQGNTLYPGSAGAGVSIGADSAIANSHIAVIGNNVVSAGGAFIYCSFASACTFEGNTLKDCGSYGFWYTESRDCTFVGNVLDGAAGHGIRIVSSGERLTVQGNIIQSVGTANNGIEAATGSGHRFTGNQFTGTMNRGINCSSSSCVISANYFSATTGAAIRVAGSDVAVSDNVCIAPGESGGIWVTGARVNVVGNQVRGAVGHGIAFASGGNDGVVVGNIITNSATTKDGIRIDDCVNVVVSGNRASGTAQEHGLHSTGTANGLSISGNAFSGNVTDRMLLAGSGNQINVSAGTAFPTSPATNEPFYRTDRNLEYFYDGTRWLTKTLYQLVIPNTVTVLPLTATTAPYAHVVAAQTSAYDAYLVDFRLSTFIATTNSTTAFWTFVLRNSAGTTIATATTSADAANVWASQVVSINALLGTTQKAFDVTATKTSTPGNAHALASVTYRLVG